MMQDEHALLTAITILSPGELINVLNLDLVWFVRFFHAPKTQQIFGHTVVCMI